MLANLYNQKINQISDIYQHIPTLYNYALQVNHITECGVRGITSSYAFAYALATKPNQNKFVMVDTEIPPSIDAFINQCRFEAVNTIFYHNSDLNCPLEQTDLLFIDTFHVYGQLKRELQRWNSWVNHYIILHDTTVDEWEGEVIRGNFNPIEYSQKTNIPAEELTRGLWPAIEEFLLEHPEWKLHERFHNNNGLTILKKIKK